MKLDVLSKVADALKAGLYTLQDLKDMADEEVVINTSPNVSSSATTLAPTDFENNAKRITAATPLNRPLLIQVHCIRTCNALAVLKEINYTMVLMTLGWDGNGSPVNGCHEDSETNAKILRCYFDLLAMENILLWFVSHHKRLDVTHPKLRFVPISFGRTQSSIRYGVTADVYVSSLLVASESLRQICVVKPGARFGPKVFLNYDESSFRKGVTDAVISKIGGRNIYKNASFSELMLGGVLSLIGISPHGTGMDGNRHLELLSHGLVTVMDDSPDLRELYGNLPVIYVKTWEQLSCNTVCQYADKVLRDPSPYHFDKLSYQYWQAYVKSEVCKVTGGKTAHTDSEHNGAMGRGERISKGWTC
jgi:hypothetical protein